jgi:hypothetical protein
MLVDVGFGASRSWGVWLRWVVFCAIYFQNVCDTYHVNVWGRIRILLNELAK